MVAFGAFAGAAAGLVAAVIGLVPPDPRGPTALPLPHHVPRHPGGLTLRFAMVHDTLHERYPRPGTAWLKQRENNCRAGIREAADRLQPGRQPPPAYFDLRDDLGAALARLGERDEAVRVLREKLAKQRELGQEGRDLYTGLANLGVALVLGRGPAAAAGDADARRDLAEGRDRIREAMAANPRAHFGRELWLLAAVEYVLAGLDDPTVWGRFDLVGDRLDADLRMAHRDAVTDRHGWTLMARSADQYARPGNPDEAPADYRNFVTRVGAEEGWDKIGQSHKTPVPFDEPALGIVGVWQELGPDPHLAVALGEIMLRVGQRYVAWCAYERAGRLAEEWPESVRQRLKEHCRKRQAQLEQTLPPSERDELRPRFDAELAHGRRYQADYHRYEAERVGAGASVDDPNFYGEFHSSRPPIASPVGDEERFLVRRHDLFGGRLSRAPAAALAGAGLGALLAALVARRAAKAADRSSTRAG
jgi:hypothetical protein